MSEYRCRVCGAKLVRQACWVRARDGAQFCFAHLPFDKPQPDMIAALDAWIWRGRVASISALTATLPPITAGVLGRVADRRDDAGDVLGCGLLDEGRGPLVGPGEHVPPAHAVNGGAFDDLKHVPERCGVLMEERFREDDAHQLGQGDLRRDIVGPLLARVQRAAGRFFRLFGHGASSPCAPGAGVSGGAAPAQPASGNSGGANLHPMADHPDYRDDLTIETLRILGCIERSLHDEESDVSTAFCRAFRITHRRLSGRRAL